MTGRLERPSQPPRENRKAANPPLRSASPAVLRSLYAAKIAAALLYAARHEVAAIIAALRSEERAALAALRTRRIAALRPSRRRRFCIFRRPARPVLMRSRKRGADIAAPSK